jgi:hypothetical protein
MELTTVIFSSHDDLLVPYLVQELVGKGCFVTIVCQDPSLYSRFLPNLPISNLSLVRFALPSEFHQSTADYTFAIDSGTKMAHHDQNSRGRAFTAKQQFNFFEAARAHVKGGHGKLLEIHSLFSTVENPPVEVRNYKVFYLGELYGVGMSADSEIGKMLYGAATSHEIVVSSASNQLFLIAAASAAQVIARQAFSYWYGGRQEIAAIAHKSNYTEVMQTLREGNSNLVLSSRDNMPKQFPAPGITYLKLKEETFAFLPVLVWFQAPVSAPPLPKPIRVQKTVLPKVKVAKVKKVHALPQKQVKRIMLTVIGLLWLALSPALLLTVSVIALKQSVKMVHASNQETAAPLLQFAKTSGQISRAIFSRVDFLPSRPFALVADTITKSARLGQVGMIVLRDIEILRAGVLGKKEYDLKGVSDRLFTSLDTLYTQTALLEAQVKSSSFLSSFVPVSLDIQKAREYLWAAREVSTSLPELLSGDQPKTYLFLFQNNMELRPTGGFIGSFALVTFDRGQLINSSVFDVYTADGQLKGHVEPPTPIRDYLGEANWYLRDSNWDPDFPTSAARAEWFLDKELERKVDGVIAMDLHVVRALLSYTGPIQLADFNMQLDEKNVYEKIQHEVESEFFPGSTKKASLLTALSKELLTKLTDGSVKGPAAEAKFAELLIRNLEEKHLLFALHEQSAQEAMYRMNWDGGLRKNTCGSECFESWVSVIDANVGVNKANYYLEKTQKLDAELKPDAIDYTLSVTMKNTSTESLKLGGQYKSYLRVFVPSGIFSKGTILEKGRTLTVEPEIEESEGRTSAGVVVSVPPLSEVEVTLHWSQKIVPEVYSKQLPLSFRFIKQAGTDETPTTISFRMPSGRSIVANPGFDLTEGSVYRYNSNLVEDFTSTFYFK